ncbi:MAG: PEGA domain-containing protein [Kofleriaceae bacterium]
MTKLVAIIVVVCLSGCATLFASKTSQLPVATNPPGAIVYVNGAPVGQTPTIVELEGRRPANIQIYLPGFQPVQIWRAKSFSGWFWVNILFWPGFFVDLATGSHTHYDDGGIAIGLTPAQGPPPDWYQNQQPQYQPPPPPGPGVIQPGTAVPQVPLNPEPPPPPSR